jgi:hypothetical protein
VSIQLLVIPVRKLFDQLLACKDDERYQNFARFDRLVSVNSRSCSLDFENKEGKKGEFFDFLISEVELLFDVAEREFPDLRNATESYIYLPVSNPGERFHFDLPLMCEGEEVTWKVSDINSLKEWLTKLTEFNRTQQAYDRDLLSSALRNYAEAIPVAERERFVIFFSH